MSKVLRQLIANFVACVVLCPVVGRAYEIPTHKMISDNAVQASQIDSVLRDQLQLTAGVNTVFLGRRAAVWIADGAGYEDQPEYRVLNHFHDPLAPSWDTAGLRVVFQVGQSSVLWQQNPNQNGSTVLLQGGKGVVAGGQNWSWKDARESYRRAVTAAEEATRELAFADVFRSLGQLVHLVQDAAVPAHVRNDAHLDKDWFHDSDGYERWVDQNLSGADVGQALGSPVYPARSIFTPTGYPGALSPVARLIDADTYTGKNPSILTTDQVGMAEYTNGNFFSKDTIFVSDALLGAIPLPARATVLLGPKEFVPALGQLRRYFTPRPGFGEPVPHLALPGALYEFLPAALQDQNVTLDDAVHRDYAGRLLRRAVGYSAALLDYFFRGRLEVSLDSGGLVITNATGERMTGDFSLHYDALGGKRVLLKKWEQRTLAAGQSTERLELPPMPESDPPARPDQYTVVFSGQLGAEPGAVAVRRFTPAPPSKAWLWQPSFFSENQAPPVYSGWLLPIPVWRAVTVGELLLYYALPDGAFELFGSLSALYRNVDEFPGTLLTLYASGGCIEWPSSETWDPVIAHFVEYYEPGGLESLQGLTSYVLPAVKRVLRTVELSATPQELTVDVTGVSFFGLRLGEYPAGYPARPSWPDVNMNRCDAWAYVLAAQ